MENTYILRRDKVNQSHKEFIQYAQNNSVNAEELDKIKYELSNKARIIEARFLKSNVEILLEIEDVFEDKILFKLANNKIFVFKFYDKISDDFMRQISEFIEDNIMINLYDMDLFFTFGDWEYWTEDLLNLYFKYGKKEI